MTQTPFQAGTTTRTDDEIKAAVIEELDYSPGTGAAAIDVTVSGGAVTLSGQVDTYPELLRAGRAAQRVRGVVGLAQEITVRGSWDAVTDSDLARSAGEALRRAVNIPDSVQVEVRGRSVRLTGAVAWQFQRQAAEHVVQYLRGVGSVTNLVEVRPEAEPVGVEHAIKAALVRHADVEASHVTVTMEAGIATLTGTVLTWAERREVEDACWSARGVSVVVNDLTIGAT
jgi:osmotically-inducible protein OsmY